MSSQVPPPAGEQPAPLDAELRRNPEHPVCARCGKALPSGTTAAYISDGAGNPGIVCPTCYLASLDAEFDKDAQACAEDLAAPATAPAPGPLPVEGVALTPARFAAMVLFAKRADPTKPDALYLPGDLFPDRDNQDAARRRTLRSLEASGLFEVARNGAVVEGYRLTPDIRRWFLQQAASEGDVEAANLLLHEPAPEAPTIFQIEVAKRGGQVKCIDVAQHPDGRIVATAPVRDWTATQFWLTVTARFPRRLGAMYDCLRRSEDGVQWYVEIAAPKKAEVDHDANT